MYRFTHVQLEHHAAVTPHAHEWSIKWVGLSVSVYQLVSPLKKKFENSTYIGINIYKSIQAKNISSVHFRNGKNNLNIVEAKHSHMFIAEYTDVGYYTEDSGKF